MSTQISLTPQQEAIFGAIQAAFPTIKERTYPKVPDSWIYQLWGPLIINSIALAALVGAMVWMQFFTPKGMVIFKTYQVRSSRVPIPTIEYVENRLLFEKPTDQVGSSSTVPYSIYCTLKKVALRDLRTPSTDLGCMF